MIDNLYRIGSKSVVYGAQAILTIEEVGTNAEIEMLRQL
jgi:hypothetical protein